MARSNFSHTNNSGNHPGRRLPPSLEQRAPACGNRGSSRYVVQGYDCYFLNRRAITFIEPLPGVRVCAGCSVVPARAVQIPCGHTLCEICEYGAFARPAAQRDQDAMATHRGGVCPADGTSFAESEVNVLTFPLFQLHRHRAYCVNRRFGCPFEADLEDIKRHCLTDCGVRRKTCRHCGQENILACDTRRHSRHCHDGRDERHSRTLAKNPRHQP